jgi:glycosyltransferase involved in cell wall biosynthesis
MVFDIPILTVNYNTPELCERLVRSIRQFYNNEIVIVDGSKSRLYKQLDNRLKAYCNVNIHHFRYNIHHGNGLTYGFKTINSDFILVLDSDVVVLKNGFIERLLNEFTHGYGIGSIQHMDDNGFRVPKGIQYLHPACMLVRRSEIFNWPLPIHHGSPMIEAMKAIHNEEKSGELLIHAEWLTKDFRDAQKEYILHDWEGTVNRTGGYHLTDETMKMKMKRVVKKVVKKIGLKLVKVTK